MTIQRRRNILRLGFISAVMTACAMGAARAETAPQHGEAVNEYLASTAPDARLAMLAREAAREGRVVLYAAIGIDRAKIFLDMFNAKYPNVKVDFVRLTVNELAQRVMAESRTGRVGSDVIMTTPDWFGVIGPAIGSYRPTTWSSYDPRFLYQGQSPKWAALDYEILPEAIAWRTDRVKSAEAPKTLDDLADPKWSGRLGTVTNLERVVDAFTGIYGEKEAIAKIEALAKNKNRLYPTIGGLSSALASGEVDVAWGVGAYRAAALKASGAPVDYVIPSPTLAISIAMGVTRNAPHPYAAALMTEFLSDATTLEKSDAAESGRTFGNLKGKYQAPVTGFHNLVMIKAIAPDKLRDYNRMVERLFIRAQ